MALIRATCSDCGDVELTECDVHVRICNDTHDATYRFRCPLCGMTEVKIADEGVVAALTRVGCSIGTWWLPHELSERPKDGGPITYDDILDFHECMTDGGDWFSTLLAVTRLDAD